jgi:hypothetical protein
MGAIAVCTDVVCKEDRRLEIGAEHVVQHRRTVKV